MRKTVAFAIAIAVLLAACYLGSPFLGFYRLQEAAKSGDQDALETVVDFPVVRGNLKAQLNAGLMSKLQADPKLKGNAFAALGMMFATAVIDKLVDSYLTPQAIGMMVTRARAPKPGGTADSDRPPQLDRGYGYINLDRFRVTVADHGRPDMPLGFVMERRGLVGWKLIRIELPGRLFD